MHSWLSLGYDLEITKKADKISIFCGNFYSMNLLNSLFQLELNLYGTARVFHIKINKKYLKSLSQSENRWKKKSSCSIFS